MLIWFPEGWRSPDGKLLPFHDGVGHIVERSKAVIIPTLISGTLEAWPRGKMLPQPGHVKIAFGEPVFARTLLDEIPSAPDRVAQVSNALRQRMISFGSEIGLDLAR